MKNKFSIAMSLAVVLAILLTSLALAAELFTAEVTGTTNDVTVIQGGAAVVSTIQLSATGSISSQITAANASTAQVDTVYTFTGGVLSSSTSSAPLKFYSSGTSCNGGNCDVTWDTSPNPYAVVATFSADASTPVGTYTITLSSAAGTTDETNPGVSGGKLNDSTPTNITVHVVAPVVTDSTAPVITPTVVGTLGANGWYTSDVALSWSVADNESTISSSSGCDSTTINTDTAGTTFTCTATSAGGTNAKSVTVKRDASQPSISAAPDVAVNAYGWNNSDVTVSYSCTDNGPSGVDAAASSLGNDLLTASGTAAGTCVDLAGNSASTSYTAKIDKDVPTASASVSPAANANGWNNTDVTVSFSGNDGSGSGIASCSTDVVLSAEGANQSASGTCTDKAGNVSAAATKSGINIDKTAPSITAQRDTAANLAGWNNTDVASSYTASDALSGLAAPASGSFTFTAEGAGQSHTFTVSDLAGNSASATVSGVSIDKTAPTISGAPDRAANSNSWYKADVTVTFTCGDALSGIASCTNPSTLQEGANQSVAGTATDVAGNSASTTVSNINIDKTAPTASASASPAANANGWNNTSVTVSFSGTDGLSGIVSCDTASVLSTEAANQSASGTCTDKAGNVSAQATASGINIDKTAPALNISGAVSGAANVCALPGKPSFAPSDDLSGIDTQSDNWSTPSNPSGVGTYTYSASATDLAGNTTSETRTYTVTYGSAFSGFLQPINTDGSSRFKLGSTIPVKFQLTCNGVFISNAVAKLNVTKGDNQADAGVDEAISTAASTTGNLFRYDSTAQQYIFNLSTKSGYMNPGTNTTTSFTTGTWTLKILLDDGKWYSVLVQLPK